MNNDNVNGNNYYDIMTILMIIIMITVMVIFVMLRLVMLLLLPTVLAETKMERWRRVITIGMRRRKERDEREENS